MRKVILNLAVSLDSFIEGPNGEYDWCMTDQDYGMTPFLERTDAIFFGRKSYELLMQNDPTFYTDKKKYIFSRTLKQAGVGDTVIAENVARQVSDIKNQPGKDIWLFGGASLITTFLNEGLVDELMLSVHPLLLGSGKPLFSGIHNRIPCRLVNCITYNTGLVQQYYEIVK